MSILFLILKIIGILILIPIVLLLILLIFPICYQIEGKENGTYLVLSKFEEDVVFEYHITVSDDNFNLGILTMKTPEGVFETDFDR